MIVDLPESGSRSIVDWCTPMFPAGAPENCMLDRRTLVLGLTAATVSGRASAAALLPVTPQEMLGPFYPEHPLPDHDFDLTRIHGHSSRARGEVIELVGRVLRRDGTAVPNATVEVWQANAAGRYRHPSDTSSALIDPDFQGYAKLLSGKDGSSA